MSFLCSQKEEKKTEILTALLKLGTAQAEVLLNEWSVPEVTSEDLDKTMKEMAKWIDLADVKVSYLASKLNDECLAWKKS